MITFEPLSRALQLRYEYGNVLTQREYNGYNLPNQLTTHTAEIVENIVPGSKLAKLATEYKDIVAQFTKESHNDQDIWKG